MYVARRCPRMRKSTIDSETNCIWTAETSTSTFPVFNKLIGYPVNSFVHVDVLKEIKIGVLFFLKEVQYNTHFIRFFLLFFYLILFDKNFEKILNTRKFFFLFFIIFITGTARLRCTEGTFRVHNIYGDGNCMFRAISYILWRNEDEHRYLRSMVRFIPFFYTID